MACCKGAEYGNWCDDVEIVWTDPETGDEYCLFHAPANRKGMDEKKFISQFEDHINYHSLFYSTIDMRGIIAPCQLTIINNILFQHIRFDNSIFEHGLSIINCSMRSLYLNHVKINSFLTFDNIDIYEIFEMKNSDIDRIVLSFSTAPKKIFSHNINSITATFTFKSPPIHIETHFNQCQEIEVRADDSTTLVKAFAMHSNTINSRLKVIKLGFHSPILATLSNCNTSYIQCFFNELKTDLLDINNPILFMGCVFKRIQIYVEALPNLKFLGCSFPKCNGRNITSDSSRYIDSPSPLFTPFIEHQPRTLEETYRQLKVRAQTDENKLLASDWHYWEKFFAERRLKEEKDYVGFIILWCYHTLSGYGESIHRAGSWLIILLFIPFLVAFTYGTLAPDQISLLWKSTQNFVSNPTSTAKIFTFYAPYYFPPTDWTGLYQNALDYIPLATKTPETNIAGWNRLFQLGWQVLITLQATLLGFALRNRYRR